jgi:hypothetical protein
LSRRKASLSLIRRVDTTVPAQGFELPAQYWVEQIRPAGCYRLIAKVY